MENEYYEDYYRVELLNSFIPLLRQIGSKNTRAIVNMYTNRLNSSHDYNSDPAGCIVDLIQAVTNSDLSNAKLSKMVFDIQHEVHPEPGIRGFPGMRGIKG